MTRWMTNERPRGLTPVGSVPADTAESRRRLGRDVDEKLERREQRGEPQLCSIQAHTAELC